MSLYECAKCGFTSKQREVIRRHLAKQKKCVNILNNSLNEGQIYNISLTNKHKNIHNICNCCNQTFTRKYSLTCHIRNNVCGVSSI